MKKMFIIAFILMALSLTACSNAYQKNQFFSNELLELNKISDLPVPVGVDNSVIQYGDILYLNITEDEYIKYVGDLLEYLKSKDDIYYLGYSVGSGLVAEMFPYDEIAPITETYKASLDNHDLFFSKNNELNDENFLSEPVEIEIIRVDGKLNYQNYEYNTQISIDDGYLAHAQWNICGATHTYDDGKEYKIPGSNNTIIEYTCINCGSTDMSDFIGDMKIYNIIIEDTNADHYIIKRSKSAPSGVIINIVTQKLIDADIKFIVNGTEIKPSETDDDKWSYDFIMPCCDVVITTEVVTSNTSTDD